MRSIPVIASLLSILTTTACDSGESSADRDEVTPRLFEKKLKGTVHGPGPLGNAIALCQGKNNNQDFLITLDVGPLVQPVQGWTMTIQAPAFPMEGTNCMTNALWGLGVEPVDENADTTGSTGD